MKYIVILLMAAGTTALFASCDKVNEVPPRDQTVVRDYQLMSAPFLTPEEREILNKKREEYQSIL